jgi:DNA-binding transcriptional MocR family regulator
VQKLQHTFGIQSQAKNMRVFINAFHGKSFGIKAQALSVRESSLAVFDYKWLQYGPLCNKKKGMKQTNSIISGYGTTVFTVMSQLATEHGAINLGQGFPDQDGPADIREVAARAMIDGPNQYPPMMGMLELRQAVANANKRFYNLDVDVQTQVMVTSGATEALADCLLGLINPGDEVVMIEPL